jgi:hypothetical protein
MQAHTALMATRKGERKAASQPASDSARRVLQKVAERAGMHTVPAQSDAMLNALVEAHMRFIDTKSIVQRLAMRRRIACLTNGRCCLWPSWAEAVAILSAAFRLLSRSDVALQCLRDCHLLWLAQCAVQPQRNWCHADARSYALGR